MTPHQLNVKLVELAFTYVEAETKMQREEVIAELRAITESKPENLYIYIMWEDLVGFIEDYKLHFGKPLLKSGVLHHWAMLESEPAQKTIDKQA